jgi:putative phosphoesterase
MIIALLGDIHANYPALKAVLDHCDSLGIKKFWNLGDIVGYNAFPNEVIQTLITRQVISISGNFDVKTIKAKKEGRQLSQDPLKQLTFKWTYQVLTKENRRYLKALPRDIRYLLFGKRILLTHASPVSKKEHLNLNTPNERLEFLANHPDTNADIVIVGHSHDPFVRQVAGTWFINTGSIGRSDDGDQRACYATLEISETKLNIIHYRIPYDVKQAVKGIQQNELPPEFAAMLLTGRGLTGHARFIQKINKGNE